MNMFLIHLQSLQAFLTLEMKMKAKFLLILLSALVLMNGIDSKTVESDLIVNQVSEY